MHSSEVLEEEKVLCGIVSLVESFSLLEFSSRPNLSLIKWPLLKCTVVVHQTIYPRVEFFIT
jgi:hypothetical protein